MSDTTLHPSDPLGPVETWRKSSFSGSDSNCVELAAHGDEIALRDSKHPDGPVLKFTRAELHAFVLGVKDGEFDDLAECSVPDNVATSQGS